MTLAHVTPYPLTWPIGWERQPHPRKKPSGSAKCGFVYARDKISEEMRRTRGDEPVLSTNCRLHLNGQPRGDGLVSDPGVAIYFNLKGKPMVMATDYYSEVASNIWRLAMAMAYLRGLERHGGGTMLERAFSGFAALPAPGTKANAWLVLGLSRDEIMILLDEGDRVKAIDSAYRGKAKVLHPDVGGTADQMSELNAARDEALREAIW